MPFSTRNQKFPEIQCGIFRRIESVLDSITSRCSRKKPAFRGTKTGYERATEIEPKSASYQGKWVCATDRLAGVIQIISNCRSSLRHFHLVTFPSCCLACEAFGLFRLVCIITLCSSKNTNELVSVPENQSERLRTSLS